MTLASLLTGDCARIKSSMNKKANEDASESEAARANYSQELELHRASLQGQLFRERYRLQEFLHSSLETGGPGPGFWPDIKGYRVRSYETNHINAGSFGDVWKAEDAITGKSVAIKIFYKRCDPPKCFGKHEFLTWLTATPQQQQELSANGKECQLVKDMLMNEHLYPPGAGHICDCYAEHVTDGWGTRNPLFLVQELCGRDIQFNIIDSHKADTRVVGSPGDIGKARSVTFQILQVLHFLEKFQTPIIHRDLKPENVNIVDNNVKVIDWGLTKFATARHASDPPAGTPGYIPPEVLTTYKAFGFPSHSFDVYSTGLIYLQLLCPDLPPPAYWNYKVSFRFDHASIQRKLSESCPRIDLRAVDDDVRVISRMLDWHPQNRQNPESIIKLSSAFSAFRREQQSTKQVKPDPGLHPVGTRVEYFSQERGGWLDAVVAGYATSSTYILNYPDGTSLREAADPKKVRLPRRGNDKLDVNDKVTYESSSQGKLCGIISRVFVDSSKNVVGYRLNQCVSGEVLHERADPSKVKRWKAKVNDALSLPDYKRLLPVPQEFVGKVSPPRKESFQFKVGDWVQYKNLDGVYLEGAIAAVRQDRFGERYDVPGVVMNASPVMLLKVARRP